MLLILPVFLTIVFSIMEMGNIAFWVIMLNHATYEVARIEAMMAWSPGTGPGGSPTIQKDTRMQSVMNQIIKGARIKTAYAVPAPFTDPQSLNINYDLMVKGEYDVQMIFPITSILFSNPPPMGTCPQGPGGGKCTMTVTMRMPIEQPLYR